MGEESAAVDSGATFDDGVVATQEQPIEQAAAVETPPVDAPPVEEKPKVTFDDAQQEVFNAAIGKKTAAQREAERSRDDLQRQLDEVKAKIPQEQAPVIPEMPDQFEDDFEQKSLARDQAIANLSLFQGAQAMAAQQQQAVVEAQQATALEAHNTKISDYAGRAEKLGISNQELLAAGNMINSQVALDESVAGHILNEAQGPAITVYLSKNPEALAELSGMTPMQAAVFIEGTIKPKAIAGNPGIAPPPAPVASLTGSGKAEGDRGPAGATFE